MIKYLMWEEIPRKQSLLSKGSGLSTIKWRTPDVMLHDSVPMVFKEVSWLHVPEQVHRQVGNSSTPTVLSSLFDEISRV